MSTALDKAHHEMLLDKESDDSRLKFLGAVASAELFLLLENQAKGDQIEPQIFNTEDGAFVLAFDTEYRLTDFTGKISPYAAISGRALAKLISARGLGIGLNIGVAPSSFLLPEDGVKWLRDTLSRDAIAVEADISRIVAPTGVPDVFLSALDARLAQSSGLADFACLAGVFFQDGKQGHILALVDVVAGAEDALVQVVNEALIFSGLDIGEIDVAIVRSGDPVVAHLVNVGIKFDLPKRADTTGPQAPGMNPDQPPKLR